MRRLATGVAVVMVVLLLAGGLFLARLRTGPGLPDGVRTVAGLEGPVEVLWDSVGIPHVWASTQGDALFAQGWVHATHRLWQMEMFRRVAQGRLAEIFGEPTLPTDRFLRTLGMDRAAAAGAALLPDEERRLLEAYAAGVNAAIDGWEGPLPPEFLILGIQPEPYRLEDVLALEKIMAWDLANYNSSLDLAQAHARLGDEGFPRVAPRYPRNGISILESAGLETRPEAAPDASSRAAAGAQVAPGGGGPVAQPADPARMALLDHALRGTPDADATGGAAFDFLSAVNTVRASNSWVVGPERSASGKPLVANDMHLGLDKPTIWYLMALHAPGMDVAGMSLPGTGGIVAGRTGGVAWGFTNATLDDTELYLERIHPEDSTRYLTPEGSEPFELRTEIIPIRGGGEDTLVVRSTRHGPVITDVESRAGGELISLRWVALEPSTTPAALLGMNRASTASEFLEALEGFVDPHQNVVFADTAGTWGYWMAGRIPRRPGVRPPLLPVPGWTGEAEWDGYLSFQDHPHAVNPPSGLVATANHRQSWTPVGDRISAGTWASPYRGQRITDLLAARTDHDVASMQTIQRDVTTLFGLAHRDAAARSLAAAGYAELADSVAAWDGVGRLESVVPTLFHAWYEALRDALRVRAYGPGEAWGYLSHAAVLDALSVGLPEELQRRTGEAAAAAATPWGEVHQLSLDHPLSQVWALDVVFEFDRKGIPRAGTPHTVDVAGYGRGDGFPVQNGASQRHVSDLADLDAGGFVIPGGQSGYPGGRHALDQLPIWMRGELIPVPLSRAGAEVRAVSRTELRPHGHS